MLYIIGLVEIGAAAALLYFEDKEKRLISIVLLIAYTLLDAFVIHFPLDDSPSRNSYEIRQMLLSLTITCSLIMVAGFRHN